LIRAVLLDVDGTLVDSNDAHAHAWVEAFAAEGLAVDFEAVRRAIGMGGDKLMPAVSGIEEASPTGGRISARRGDIFKARYLPTLKPFRDAGALVAALSETGYRLVAASSAKRDELEPLLRIAGADALLHGATSSDDADESKPEPDIIHAALKQAKATPGEAILLGDTPYDIEAAARAGVATIAFRCGGWGDADLAGAVQIYDGPWDLLAQLAASPLGVRGRTS
jgi:phosphoglycolate phosphatase-like HAD superfamily hydrolase